MVSIKRDIFYGFLILLFVSVFIRPAVSGWVISPLQGSMSAYGLSTTLIALGTLLSGVVAFKPASKPYHIKALENYIQKCLDYGKTQTEIKDLLSSTGWDDLHIDKHLGEMVQKKQSKELSNFYNYLSK